MSNKVNPEYPVIDLIKSHWSPRSFSDKTVSNEILQKVFESARWASSCFNEQPWRFILGVKDQGDTYNKILASLMETNQAWAKTAPVLVVVCAKKTFTMNGNPNAWAEYDAGQAVGFLNIQAHNEGLYSHQMAGFSKDKVNTTFNIPEDFNAVCVISLGYLGDASTLSDDLKSRETAPSQRKEITSLVFCDDWGTKSDLI